jgi:hypothetical protein
MVLTVSVEPAIPVMGRTLKGTVSKQTKTETLLDE